MHAPTRSRHRSALRSLLMPWAQSLRQLDGCLARKSTSGMHGTQVTTVYTQTCRPHLTPSQRKKVDLRKFPVLNVGEVSALCKTLLPEVPRHCTSFDRHCDYYRNHVHLITGYCPLEEVICLPGGSNECNCNVALLWVVHDDRRRTWPKQEPPQKTLGRSYTGRDPLTQP